MLLLEPLKEIILAGKTAASPATTLFVRRKDVSSAGDRQRWPQAHPTTTTVEKSTTATAATEHAATIADEKAAPHTPRTPCS